MASCGMCDAVIAGVAEAHCIKCHRTFTSVSAFDKHQTISNGTVCRDPATIGMAIRHRAGGRSVWTTAPDPRFGEAQA